ncbi:MAG: HugZ family protein [Methylobacteriaceae bacterium]|nr:HugZ family protein [Methylobacteriaceae bacterium]
MTPSPQLSRQAEASPGDSRPAPEPAFHAILEAKRLLRRVRAGALASLAATGYPFASLVNVATDYDGSPLLLLSRLAAHTANLERDQRCSVLLSHGGKGDPLAHPRLTIIGRIERTQDEHVRGRFLRRHPKSELYAGFADFSFWRVGVERAHLNGGFARAADFAGEAVLTNLDGAGALLAAEEGAVVHLNQDHREALGLYATKLLGEAEGFWRATGIDPEGMDLAAGDRTTRLTFDNIVANPGDLRSTLVRLASRARALAHLPAQD